MKLIHSQHNSHQENFPILLKLLLEQSYCDFYSHSTFSSSISMPVSISHLFKVEKNLNFFTRFTPASQAVYLLGPAPGLWHSLSYLSFYSLQNKPLLFIQVLILIVSWLPKDQVFEF